MNFEQRNQQPYTGPGDLIHVFNVVCEFQDASRLMESDVLKATVTRSRRWQNVADGLITGLRKFGFNMFLFVCVVTLLTPETRW